MSQSVDRLKELLFNSETHALKELALRIDGLAETETNARQDLLRRLELIAECDTRSREELALKLEEIYARAGNEEHLTQSVAEIISEALRRAEVERHAELSNSIAPLVVSTIKTELRNSQDEMVEALYPLTGRLVKSYVASALKDLTEQMNRRLEQNPVMLRFQSLTTGRPVGELALASTQDFDIKELYLIRRGSGELVAHWPDGTTTGREHAMSGVLAAINEFATEAFSATDSNLRQIDLGGEEVYLRGSPIYLLAARCSGQAPKAIEQTIDDAFLLAVERQHAIDAGTPTSMDASAARAASLADVGEALKSQVAAQIGDFKRPAGKGALKAIAALIILPIIGWYAWSGYMAYTVTQTRSAAERIIASDPAMLGYPVQIGISAYGGEMTVSGLTPSQQAKTRIVSDLGRSLPNVAVTDKLSVVAGSDIVVPDVSPELARVRQEITSAFSDVTRAARTRAHDRASARLQQASSDLGRAAAASESARREGFERISSEIQSIQAKLPPVAEGTSDTDEQRLAAYTALTTRLGSAGNDLLQTIGATASDVGQTIMVPDGPAANLDTAIEQFAAASERLAALAAATSAANLLIPPPQAPVILPAPLTARQKLAAWAESHAIFFGDDLDYRDPSLAANWLAELAALLKPEAFLIRVVGYTDETGGAVRNVQLARDRAEKVRADLLELGVQPSKLVAVGRANALDLSDSKGPNSPNRRVQFEIGFESEAQQ